MLGSLTATYTEDADHHEYIADRVVPATLADGFRP